MLTKLASQCVLTPASTVVATADNPCFRTRALQCTQFKYTYIYMAMMDDGQSHICISSHCGKFCTPKEGSREEIVMYHSCADPCRSGKQVKGLKHHMCRKCHQSGKVCKTAVCYFRRCSLLKDSCKHLHPP